MPDLYGLVDPLLAGASIIGVAMARYAPTQKGNLLKHSMRQQILERIEEHPGLSTSELSNALGCSWTTTNYHLRQLDESGLVTKVRSGRRIRFFHGKTNGKTNTIAMLKQGRIMEFVQAIVDTPGVVQKQVAEQLNMSRKVMGTYVQRLTQAGLVKEVRDHGCCKYLPTSNLHDVLESMSIQSPDSDSSPGEDLTFI